MCVCIYLVGVCVRRDKNRQPGNQGGRQVKRNFFCCFVLFIYFPLNCHTPSSGCQCVLGGPFCDITRGCGLAIPWNLWSSEGSFCGGYGAPWENIVGAFQRLSQLACPLSLPLQWLEGKCFFCCFFYLKCSSNTLSQEASHAV